MPTSAGGFHPQQVWDFWFPDNGHSSDLDSHRDFWIWRMTGRADEDICNNFTEMAEAAVQGQLDHWAETKEGWLALIIVLDQFSRSVWRDSPQAFAQDIKAARLALDGIKSGFYQQLENVWEKNFVLICIGHCEGPDHLERIDLTIEMSDKLKETAPKQLTKMYELSSGQPRLVRGIIQRFGRHAHRNEVLGRISTAQEIAYVKEGKFPHNRPPSELDAQLKAGD